MKTAEDRNRFVEQHRIEMNARAKEQGVQLKGSAGETQEQLRERSEEQHQVRDQD